MFRRTNKNTPKPYFPINGIKTANTKVPLQITPMENYYEGSRRAKHKQNLTSAYCEISPNPAKSQDYFTAMKIIETIEVFRSSAKPCTRKVQLLFPFYCRVSNDSHKHAFSEGRKFIFFYIVLHFHSSATCGIVVRSGRREKVKEKRSGKKKKNGIFREELARLGSI